MTYAWLVENFTKDGQSTGLYMLCQVNMTVTADVNLARRFRLQRTAEFRAADMREARQGWWRAVEHGFEDRPPEFECLGEPALCANPRGCGCVPDSKTPNSSLP